MHRIAVVLVLLATPLAAAELKVPITVEERVGIARSAEPVTCGVPLTKGLMDDVKNLVLLSSEGKPVDAAFTIVNRWYPEKSVKWVHIDFIASAPVRGKTTYTLTTGQPKAVDNPIRADLKDGKATVDTGAIRFTVKKDAFNLFDEVWAGDKQVVASHKGGIELVSSHMGLKENKRYSAAAYDKTTVEIEEQNPMKVVLKVTGAHISTDKLPGPERLLDYELRIYAYRGSPAVKVVYTVMNRQEDRIHVPLCVDGILVELPIKIDGEPRGRFPMVDGSAAGARIDGGIFVCADASDHHFTYQNWKSKFYEGKCKTTNTCWLGWISVSGNTGGAMGGIRRFWQLWPKAVEVIQDGRLRLYPWPSPGDKVLELPKQDDKTPNYDNYAEAGKDYPIERALRSRLVPGRAHFFPGMSKTHEMVFHFFEKENHDEVLRSWMSLERPLRAVCPPSWYCEQTLAFGRVPSASPELFDDATAKLLKDYDVRFRDWLDWLIQYRSKEYGKDFGVYDQYGMFDFGDSINWERMKGQYNKPNEAKPVSFHWDNCYYDVPHAMMLQFLRTGDLDFLEYANEAEGHYMDVDMVCYNADKSFIGAPRYCPGRMHICQDGTSIYVSDTYNHFKNLCHFDLWFLLGDHHARDRGYMQAGFVVARGRSGLSQARSVGHGIQGALAAYRASGDEKYLKAAQSLVNYNFTRTGSGAWQDGIALEGFRELYEQTGDERLVQTIKNGADAAMVKKDYAPAILHAFAFTYYTTGDVKYRDVVLKQLPKLAVARKMWGSTMDLGNTLRNPPFAFWYLSDKLAPRTKDK